MARQEWKENILLVDSSIYLMRAAFDQDVRSEEK